MVSEKATRGTVIGQSGQPAADLDEKSRRKVPAHLHKAGFKSCRGRKYPGRPRNMDRGSQSAQMRKIEALLTVGGKPYSCAHALAKRICKADLIEWVPEHKLYKIITALRKQALCEGWDLTGEK